jgi:hypothetical protein
MLNTDLQPAEFLQRQRQTVAVALEPLGQI